MSTGYALLDRLPLSLRGPTMVNLHGALFVRGEAVLCLREGLLAGRLPLEAALRWPEDDALRAALRDVLAEVRAPSRCCGDPRLTDEVVAFVLAVVDETYRLRDRTVSAFHVEQRRLMNHGENPTVAPDPEERSPGPAPALERALLISRLTGLWEREQGSGGSADDLVRTLRLPPRMAAALWGELPLESRRSLCTTLRFLPPVDDIVAAVVPAAAPPATSARPSSGTRARPNAVPVPPTLEAALRVRRSLRRWWVARALERAHAPASTATVVASPATSRAGNELPKQALRAAIPEARAVVVALDASASMYGGPEVAARGILLRLLVAAHASARPLYVTTFGNVCGIVDRELTLNAEAVLFVLARCVASRTEGPPDQGLRLACRRLRMGRRGRADLVLLSAGHFQLLGSSQRVLDQTRLEAAACLHAVRLGDGTGFNALRWDTEHPLMGG